MANKEKFEKITKGEYRYRGFRIRRNVDIPPGYNGAWEAGRQKDGIMGESRRDVAEQIDKRLANPFNI